MVPQLNIHMATAGDAYGTKLVTFFYLRPMQLQIIKACHGVIHLTLTGLSYIKENEMEIRICLFQLLYHRSEKGSEKKQYNVTYK